MHRWPIICLVALLVIKFFLPLWFFHLPLGYDVGIYRYLFIRYSESLLHGSLPVLEPWAQEHPLGLFVLLSPLLIAGFPVDWLLTWVWSLMPLVLAGTLAWSTAQREGRNTGILVLLAALLSMPFQDGFGAMYWKTFAALAFGVLALHYVDRKMFVAMPLLLLCLITHNQTGLLIALVVATRWLLSIPRGWKDRNWQIFSLLLVVVAALTLVFYLPVWQRAFLSPLLSVLSMWGATAPGGSFPSAFTFLRGEGILLALGAVGFALSWKRERGTVWQLAVLWALLFVVARLVFYRRFFLQLDFFLLPYAAIAMHTFWKRFPQTVPRTLLTGGVLIQGLLTTHAFFTQTPVVSAESYRAISELRDAVPSDAFVLVLDNASVPTVRGWLTTQKVGGPGLFDSEWTYPEWEMFLTGTHEERVALLAKVPQPTYAIVTPFFRAYYGASAEAFLSDGCLHETDRALLYLVDCSRE